MEELDFHLLENKAPINVPENLPNKVDFKTTGVITPYTRVAEKNPLTQTEELDRAADILNNTPLKSKYKPNELAPIEVGVDTSRYKDKDVSLAKLQSGKLEQYAAQTQNYWERLWNDTKVSGVNLTLGFASAFTSIYDMINDGTFIPGEDSVTSKLGTIASDYAEKNSNFQTQYDVENPIKSLLLPAFMTGSSKGWGDIAKSASIGVGTGAGIFVQELGIIAITGGTGSIPILASNIRNLIRGSKTISQAAKTADALRAGTVALDAGTAAIGGVETAVKAGTTTNNIINFGKGGVRGALSAYGESAFEAQESRDNFKIEKIKEFREKNGRLPDEIELDKIKKVAEQAHDARFLLNFGLLTFSNSPFLGSVFKHFDDVMKVSEQAAAKGLKFTGRAGDGFEKSFQLKSDWWTKNAVTKGMKTAIETGQPYLKNIVTGKSITWNEGLEEGYQFWVDKATNNYYNSIYNKGTNDIIDGTFTDTVNGLAKSFYQTKEQVISTEGLQNIIGGILGGTGQSIVSKGVDLVKNGKDESWKEGSQFRKDTTEEINKGIQDVIELNTKSFKDSTDGDYLSGTLTEKLESLRGAYSGAGLMQEVNSVITFDKLKDITKWHTIAPMVMKGQVDILKDQLTSLLSDPNSISDEQFKQMTGLEEITPAIRSKYVSETLADIDKVDKSVRKNLSTFRNKYKKGTDEYKMYEDAKKIFAFHGYLSENMIERKKKLESENSILFNAPNISAALKLVTKGEGKEQLSTLIDSQISLLNSTIDTLKPVIKEGVEISEQNKIAIQEAENQKKELESLKETVNSYEGKNKEDVEHLLLETLNTFKQTDLVLIDQGLNFRNQLNNILEQYTNYDLLSTNLADHLETYNNLIESYTDSDKLKEVLEKYRYQAQLSQASFKDLEVGKARTYFAEEVTKAKLDKESSFFKAIQNEFNRLQKEKASFEDYKEAVDKNIEQFLKDKTPDIVIPSEVVTGEVDEGDQVELSELEEDKKRFISEIFTQKQIDDNKEVINKRKEDASTNVIQKLDELLDILNNKVPYVIKPEETLNEPKPEVKKPKPKEEPKVDVDTGSINSKTVESIVYVDDKGKILNLNSNEGGEKLREVANKVSNVIKTKQELDIDDLTFTLVKTNEEEKIEVLKWDKVFKRKTSSEVIRVTDKDGGFITIIQTPEKLILNTELILKEIDLTSEERANLANEITVVEALKQEIFTSTLFDKLKNKTTTTDGKTHKLLVVNENFKEFKNTILTQAENYNKLIEKEDIKKEFKKLYSGLQAYANGMNFEHNKELSTLSNKLPNKVKFTNNLPFNFIGEWEQPIFEIDSEIGSVPLNGKGIKKDNYRNKINETLQKLKKDNPQYYEILINGGKYFTAFSYQGDNIWINPISLKLENSDEKIEEQIFQSKNISETVKEISEKYIIRAFDSKTKGDSVRIRIYEKNGRVDVEFSKMIGDEKISYYMNGVNQETLKGILSGKGSPKINSKINQELKNKYGLKDELEFFGVSIVQSSNLRDRLDLLTNGNYYVTDINNSASIFQNVGFRLKFKEQKEDVSIEATTSPSIIEAPVEVKSEIENKSIIEDKDIENNDFVVKIKRIGAAHAGGKQFVNTSQTGKEALTQINYEMYGDKVKPEHLLYFKDRFGGKLYDWINRAFKELTGETFEEYDEKSNKLKEKQEEPKAPVKELIENLEGETNIQEETELPKQTSLQEISDYVWNNLKLGKPGKEYTVYELKNDLDISELNRRFVELKNALENQIPNEAVIKNEFQKDFTTKLKVKEFVRRGELPLQRAFLEDNTEIVKQYVINCK